MGKFEGEPHTKRSLSRLNSLRAAVLGANDGIVSVASIVIGVGGATSSIRTIITAGVAGLVAGALSMATGEYVSVSSQRDMERAMITQEKNELKEDPAGELKELQEMYSRKGLSHRTSMQVAAELTAHDAFAAHVDVELGIDPHNLTNPLQAAAASAASFVSGAIIPLLAVWIAPENIRIPVTFIAVLVALCATGMLSAKVGNANLSRATLRVVLGGAFAMLVTYGIGRLMGVSGI